MSFWTYMLRCSDGSYYIGHAEDLESRVGAHQAGAIPGYTEKRRPVALVWSQNFPSRYEALAAERQIKGWSRAKKEALIRDDWKALRSLAKKSFDTPVRQSSPATQDERKSNPPIIVLVRPQLGENIGKSARAMLNFGLTELRLVDPRDGWPNPSAGPAASGADIVLERAQVFSTVQEAVADCPIVHASTVRRRDLVMPVLTPEAMADALSAAATRSAILFGPERSGLETDEVALANAIVTVPINPDFASLNLAQAVILLAYEWSKKAALSVPPEKELEPPAPHGELEGLIGQLEAELEAKGYFHPQSRTQATKNTLRTIFTKSGWSSREVKAVRGVVRALAGPPRKR